MQTNNSFYEEQLINALNNKKKKDLSRQALYIIKSTFGEIDDNATIFASKVKGFQNPDFYIEINNVRKYIVLRSGTNNVIHKLNINTFCSYLKGGGISDITIETIKLFHYGDGTSDGSAKERIDYQTLRAIISNRLTLANAELNKNKDLICHIINKALFDGFKEGDIKADYLYCGNEEFGVIVSLNQIEKYLEMNRWDFYRNLHIGFLLFRPAIKYIGQPIKNAKYRELIEFYWPSIYPDCYFVSNRYPRAAK